MKTISPTLEMKAIVFIVLEHQAFQEKTRDKCVTTECVTKHIQTEHKESMAVISHLRKQGYVYFRERKSAGWTGYGYGGSLFAELTPTEQGVSRAMKYLRVGKKKKRDD